MRNDGRRVTAGVTASLLVIWSATAMAEEPRLRAFAFEQITVGGSSVGLTLTNVIVTPPAEEAHCAVETAQIRYRLDGTAPTASVGTTVNPNDEMILIGASDLYNARFIRTTSTSATLSCHYFRKG